MLKKCIKPKNGDIFNIGIDEDAYSYGQVMDVKYNLYSIYDILSNGNEDLENIKKRKIMFFTRLSDFPFENTNWNIVGNYEIPREIEFNNSKVILEEGVSIDEIVKSSLRDNIHILKGISNISSRELENAVKYEYGFEKSSNDYECIIYPSYKRYKEFNKTIKMSNRERYEYFIKNVVYFGEVWGLYNNGWAI
ncbi:Imm26 family immunity protein, partial [Romboutsia sp.]|uniref:Imm26 family immunity protein n=1 Tax=Romboutsia sp. TaxID=1965302 RepID=UPI002B91E3F1